MAGLPWIQLASDWKGSKKAITLRVFLQDEWAWTYPVSLWMWTAQHEGDGRIEGPGCVAVIAEASGWKGNPQDFVDAMVRTGLLDETSGGYYVHDWHDYAGSHIEKRKKERTRLASYRERTRTERVQNAYVQEKNADVRGERERERETDTETIPTLSSREQGAAARLEILSPKPRTHELLVELDRRGFECRPPAKAPASIAVEKLLGVVPVSVAADRVMAVVDADRRLSVVPRDTLGWYQDAIRGQPEGGRRVGKQSNPQTGVAAPADASAFGEGGQRVID